MSSWGRSSIRSGQRTGPVPADGGRVVYLTNQLPFPPHSGGQVRESQILARTSDRFVIDLVVVTNHYDRDVAHLDEALPFCRSAAVFEATPAPEAAAGLPERVWMYANGEVRGYVAGRVASGEVDLVHAEGYFLVQHVPEDLGLPFLLYEENVEYLLDRERQRLGDPGGFAPWEVSFELESAAWHRATVVGSVTEDDAAAIRETVADRPVRFLPSGCDHFAVSDGGPADGGQPIPAGPRVVYTANFDWPPSRDGAFHLTDDIWPAIRAAVPDAQLVLAGAGDRAPFESRLAADPAIHFLGRLPSFGPLLAEAAVVLCPLRYGSGVKAKVVEALYLGCAVATTPVGLQGLPKEVWDAVCCEQTADGLAARTIDVLTDPALRAELRSRALSVSREFPTWAYCADQLCLAWSSLLTEQSRA